MQDSANMRIRTCSKMILIAIFAIIMMSCLMIGVIDQLNNTIGMQQMLVKEDARKNCPEPSSDHLSAQLSSILRLAVHDGDLKRKNINKYDAVQLLTQNEMLKGSHDVKQLFYLADVLQVYRKSINNNKPGTNSSEFLADREEEDLDSFSKRSEQLVVIETLTELVNSISAKRKKPRMLRDDEIVHLNMHTNNDSEESNS